MALIVVIDGYNFIMALDRYRGLMLEEPQAAREALVKDMAEYHKIRGHPAVVVFDGKKGLWHTDRDFEERGVRVIFSARGRSADEVISEMAEEERERMVAITADRELATTVESRGAVAVGPVAFSRKLDEAAAGEEEGVPSRRNSRPGRKLGKRARKRRMKLRKL